MPTAYFFGVSPDYFHTVGTRLISGRDFNTRDKQGGQRVAIVSRAFAATLLDGSNPLGRRFSMNPGEKPIEIVGVVKTGKYYNLNEQNSRAFWTPLEVGYKSKATLVARTRMISPESVLPSVLRARQG